MVFKLTKDFRDFLKQYVIVGMALGIIMGGASSSLVKSLVNNIIMPFVNPAIPRGGWENATLLMGPVELRWGAFSAELLSFIILAFVVFIIAKKILKEEKVAKK